MNSTIGIEKSPSVGSLASRQPRASGHAGLLNFKKRVLILGSGQLASELCHVVTAKRGLFVEVVGFLDKDNGAGRRQTEDMAFLGTYDQLGDVVDRYQVDTIAVCLEDRRAYLPVQSLLDMKVMGREVVDGHALLEEESGRLSIDHLKPSTLIFSTGFQRRMLTMRVKRWMDLALSSVGLTLLFPLFALVGLIIKLDSPGPVFYRQVRVGLRGGPYIMWKFRSMRHDAERNGAAWASHNDPRVSRVGRWLRKWRIDELPQLINVFRGEMSLVGPRPERPVFVRELRKSIPYYDIRHVVKPGITGWAQIRFRYGASQEDAHMKLQYDLYYVKNLSLALDLKIMARTIKVILASEGAR